MLSCITHRTCFFDFFTTNGAQVSLVLSRVVNESTLMDELVSPLLGKPLYTRYPNFPHLHECKHLLFIASALLIFVPVIHRLSDSIASIWSHIEGNKTMQVTRVLPAKPHLELSRCIPQDSQSGTPHRFGFDNHICHQGSFLNARYVEDNTRTQQPPEYHEAPQGIDSYH